MKISVTLTGVRGATGWRLIPRPWLPFLEPTWLDLVFDVPSALKITLPEGHRWAKSTDFTGKLALFGRARNRFGATVAVFDLNGDGKLDLFLAASVVGPKGVRDALLLNKGDGQFDDVTEAYRIPLDRVSLGVAAADFDADLRVDLFLTGIGDNRLLHNTAANRFRRCDTGCGDYPSRRRSVPPRAGWILTRMATSTFM